MNNNNTIKSHKTRTRNNNYLYESDYSLLEQTSECITMNMQNEVNIYTRKQGYFIRSLPHAHAFSIVRQGSNKSTAISICSFPQLPLFPHPPLSLHTHTHTHTQCVHSTSIWLGQIFIAKFNICSLTRIEER
jgi:hypothetical protein